MLTVEKITTMSDFIKLEPFWDKLVEKSLQRLIFSTFDFIKTEWSHVGWENDNYTTCHPFILVVKEGDEIIALYPLIKEKTRFHGFPVTCIRPLSNIHADRTDMIMIDKPEVSLQKFIEYLTEVDPAWDIFMAKNVAADSCLLGLGGMALSLMRVDKLQGLQSPFVTKNCEWQEYLNARSKNYHKSIKNKTNRIVKDGLSNVAREYKTPDETANALKVAFEIDLKSWKADDGTAISSTEKSRRYWMSLTRHLAEKRRVRIWILWLNDLPVAYEYHAIYSGKVYSLKWSYDKDYRHYSPGLILKSKSMESFWKESISEIDLLGRSDVFKEEWTNRKRDHRNFYIFNKTLYARFVHDLLFCTRSIQKKIKSFRKSHYKVGVVDAEKELLKLETAWNDLLRGVSIHRSAFVK